MYQERKVFTDSIASGTSTSSGISLQRTWSQLGVAISSMSTSAQIAIQASPDGGSTFYPIFIGVPNTSSVQANALNIASGAAGPSCFIPIPATAPYIRFIASGTVNNGVVFKVVCQSL